MWKISKGQGYPGESKSRGQNPGTKTESYNPWIWGAFGGIGDEAGGVLRG